jgi:hypothetical protein
MKNRGTAWVVLALVVVLGALFGTHRSLSALRQDAAEVFYVGTDGDNYGISGRLDAQREAAQNLCKIAAKYDVAAEEAAVENACMELETAQTAHEKYTADAALTSAVDALSQAMSQQALTDEDEGYRTSLTAKVTSYTLQITKLAADYNTQVRQFNSDIFGGFPAKFLGTITGIHELEEYA